MSDPVTDTTSTRGQILTAASELFRTRGYDATSLREIADRMGLTKAALYYHFRAKEDLLSALIDPFRVRLDDLAARPPARGPDRVRSFLADYVGLLVDEHDVVSLFVRDPAILNHSQLGPWAVDVRERLYTALIGTSPKPADLTRAICAISAAGAVIFLPRELAQERRDHVVAAACAAFATA